MNLSNKEKIILVVFLSIVIIAVGLFVIILPEYNNIEPNRNALDAAKARRDEVYQTLSRESTIDQEIQDALDAASKYSLNFYEDLTPHEADVILREILEATNMHADSLSIGSYTTSTLTVADYVETAVTYPLKEYSGYTPDPVIDGSAYSIEYDESGNIVIPDEIKEQFPENTLQNYLIAVLSTRQQSVGAITVDFNVYGTRGDFLKFLDYVAGLEKATIITSTQITYTEQRSSENAGNNAAAGGEEGAEAPAPAGNNTTSETVHLDDNDEINVPVSITFYCSTPLSQEEVTAPVSAEPEA